MKTIVYLGPSLLLATAKALLTADYRPPICRGDLIGCKDVETIVIIDGQFDQSFSVTPKEILQLLHAGVRVVGSSSMGALRAAELKGVGMIGIGDVYTWYTEGDIDGDDEVALLYADDGYRPLTIPMVNVRGWLRNLVISGFAHPPLASQLARAIRAIFFKERTYGRVCEVSQLIGGQKWFRSLRRRGMHVIPDIKAEDARRALAYVAALK